MKAENQFFVSKILQFDERIKLQQKNSNLEAEVSTVAYVRNSRSVSAVRIFIIII